MSLTPSGKVIPPKERKFALLGSRSVGKSSLVVRFVDSHFVESYYPTIENTFSKKLRVNGQDFSLDIHDTAGQDEFSILNSKQAVGLHGWILVYSVTSRSTFEMISIIRDKILQFMGVDSVPLVIVGNKVDLEQGRNVTTEEGKELAKSWNCAFVEASAKDSTNVEDIFKQMVIQVEKTLNPPPEKGEARESHPLINSSLLSYNPSGETQRLTTTLDSLRAIKHHKRLSKPFASTIHQNSRMSTLSVASSSSASTSPVPSPALEPMHHPELAAKVEVPHDVDALAPGVSAMNGKALLAKKMAASGQSFYSPTDTLVSPCTAKLHLTKQMRFAKMVKPAKPALITANSYPSALGTETSSAAFLRHQPLSQTPRVSEVSATNDENAAPATAEDNEMQL